MKLSQKFENNLKPETIKVILTEFQNSKVQIDPNGLLNRIRFLATEVEGDVEKIQQLYDYPSDMIIDIISF